MSDGAETRRFPRIRLEMLEDLSPDTGPGFLRLVRRRILARYPDGTASDPFLYDQIERRAIDAVVITPHYANEQGERHVFLRSALRPPIYFRDPNRSPVVLPDHGGQLWEVPAGLVEVEEQSPEGLVRGAARELHEEAGFDVPTSALRELGPSLYPCPGVLAERLFFFEVEVDPAKQVEPTLDGSALERFGRIIDVSLRDALGMCARGDIDDAKTEISLRRLRERYS